MKKTKLLMPLAGIAAIGAVAPIAVMASCSKGVSASDADKAFLTNINNMMKYGKDYCSPHQAIQALKDNGYDVLSYRLSNINFEFAFDASAKKFIIMNGDSIVEAPTGYTMENVHVVFKFTNKYDKNSKYGQYLLDEYEWTDPTAQFEFTGSIDVGSNTNIKNMKYVSSTNDSKTVLVRTYCEYLNFAENSDTIHHMGESNNIEVYGSSASSKCNYMELGRTAYLYVKNTTLQIAKLNSVDTAQVDVLEADTGVTKGTLFHNECLTLYIGETISGVTIEKTETTEVATAAALNTAIQNGKEFIRLTADIDLVVTSTIAIADKSFVLDLNSHNLTDKSTELTQATPLISITASADDSSMIFMDSWRKGVFALNDHNITVKGNVNSGKKTASLYLEGANITYNATDLSGSATNRRGAIQAGTTGTPAATVVPYSCVYMYGGKITATTTSTTHKTEVSGIYANDSAYIQIVYGAITSATNCVRSNGSQLHSYIDIVNGTFKTTGSTNSECIYLPGGTLNIVGGTFEGHCCLGIRGGTVIIDGGYFHATGTKTDIDKDSAESGMSTDGSVICVELCNTASETTAYGTNPSLTIHNATLQSDNSYIMQIYRNNATTDITQYFEADFFGGVYYYASEVTSPTYNGIRISTETTLTDHYRIYQQSGSWIKTN